MRKRIRKPLTDRARQLTVIALTKLKAQGEDPVACLDQSVQRSYQGVFPEDRRYSGNENGSGHRAQEEPRQLTTEEKRKQEEAKERRLARYREEADKQMGLTTGSV